MDAEPVYSGHPGKKDSSEDPAFDLPRVQGLGLRALRIGGYGIYLEVHG